MSSQSVIVNGRASASSDAAVLLPACDSSDNGHLPFLNGTIGRARAHCRRGQPIHEGSDYLIYRCNPAFIRARWAILIGLPLWLPLKTPLCTTATART